MRLSRFTRFVDDEDRVVVFNSLTGALAVIDHSAARSLQEGRERGLSEDVRSGMVRGGFLIPSDVDELQVFRHLWYKAQHDMSTVGLSISPTLDCNMECGYCLAVRNQDTMSGEIADRVVDMVCQLIVSAKHLNIVWFGGEPLLALDIVEYISRRSMDIAGTENIQYRSSMFTNAYDLTEDTVSRLINVGISTVVVAVDGPRNIHEQRRPAVGGGPCFDRIMNNIVAASARLSVIVQCIVDVGNKDAAWDLFDSLSDAGYLGENLQFRMGHVDCDTVSGRVKECSDFTPVDFDRYYIQALRQRMGHPNIILPYPSMNPGCSYQRMSTLSVGPNGELYKCLKVVGCEQWVVGTVPDLPSLLSSPMVPWTGLDPLSRDGCRQCPVLPICSGGCAMAWLKSGHSRCSCLKHTLDEWLKLHVRWKEQKDATASLIL